MKPGNAIEVHNITKSFKIYLDKGSTLKERILFKSRRRFENRHVLNGISFEVKKGEAIGLIGHNGCGKSTTLKLLTRIMYPDTGTIEMAGRVSSLIELGAGFHPDMTGRENIFINASIFGLSNKEIEERLDDIIEFSELEEYIENPVRTYSSGMYMRLAFAVAINVDADILLIDEILAVGDASFQSKCFDKLREIKAQGTTIVIVSHSLGQIEQFCDRSIWIHDGEIREEGVPYVVDMNYLDYMGQKRGERREAKKEQEREKEDQSKAGQGTEKGEPEERVRKVTILGAHLEVNGKETTNIKVGTPVTLKLFYKKNEDVLNPLMGLKIYRNDNVIAYGINSKNENFDLDLKDEGCLMLEFPKWNFVQGEYHVDLAIREENMTICDYKTNIITFTTYYPIFENGMAHLDHSWKSE
ncbi:MAG: ABC transporter ATP-binding protein [Butyrivibrio sp.]|nr:ABC transporter ATP-binding protein [Butyrivibrio sp.]